MTRILVLSGDGIGPEIHRNDRHAIELYRLVGAEIMVRHDGYRRWADAVMGAIGEARRRIDRVLYDPQPHRQGASLLERRATDNGCCTYDIVRRSVGVSAKVKF